MSRNKPKVILDFSLFKLKIIRLGLFYSFNVLGICTFLSISLPLVNYICIFFKCFLASLLTRFTLLLLIFFPNWFLSHQIYILGSHLPKWHPHSLAWCITLFMIWALNSFFCIIFYKSPMYSQPYQVNGINSFPTKMCSVYWQMIFVDLDEQRYQAPVPLG